MVYNPLQEFLLMIKTLKSIIVNNSWGKLDIQENRSVYIEDTKKNTNQHNFLG